MSLKFKLTKTEYEALDEGLQKLYKASGDGFSLDVKGTDEAVELKTALDKEREERKKFQKMAKDYEDKGSDAERNRLLEKEEFKKLWETAETEKTTTAKELSELKEKISNGKRTESAMAVALKLTKDTARAGLLEKEALQFITHTDDGVKITSPDGTAWTPEQLGEHLTKSYGFLVDGSQASGGGAEGDGGGATVDISKLSPTDRITEHRKSGAK